MKYFALTLACAGVALILACGAGHPTIQSLVVSPQDAQAPSPNGEVGFTARGIFANNDSRELTVADGLEWSTSDNNLATINNTTGQATCKAPGPVTITAKAPADVTLEINNGVHNKSQTVTGTATLTCLATP
jgi:hypothetical protein